VWFAHNPGRNHWNVIKHILAYVKGTLEYKITYKGGGSLKPIGFVDSGYTGCLDTR